MKTSEERFEAELDLCNSRLRKLEKVNSIAQEKKPGGFRNFVQLNLDRKVIQAIIALGNDNPKAIIVMLYLIEKCNRDNVIAINYSRMAEDLNMSKSTIGRAIQALKSYHVIKAVKTEAGNTYIINQTLAWKSRYYNRDRCSFGQSPDDAIAQPVS